MLIGGDGYSHSLSRASSFERDAAEARFAPSWAADPCASTRSDWIYQEECGVLDRAPIHFASLDLCA